MSPTDTTPGAAATAVRTALSMLLAWFGRLFARTRSLVAHTDLSAFGRALVLEGFDRVYGLVLHEGRVRWRAFGPLTTPLEHRLRARLDDFEDESVDSVVS